MPERGMEQLIRAQRPAITLFLEEIARWNARINLTSVPAADGWRRHIDESIELLEAADPPSGAAIVDVGSGAGIPGAVIAILRRDLEVTLLEADARKAAFLDHVTGLLGLSGVTVSNTRAESAGHDPRLREAFDLAVSRAAAEPPALCELALPLVRVGGHLFALVTDAAAAATACAAASATLGGGLPGSAGRHLLVVQKIAVTDQRYPRRTGVPQRRPIR
ncbi:MAG TPA: 16S rRNA (guanine(527)-N(7))-methyltransferase RsmG [Candidatus Dormibacteraeota bacterium]